MTRWSSDESVWMAADGARRSAVGKRRGGRRRGNRRGVKSFMDLLAFRILLRPEPEGGFTVDELVSPGCFGHARTIAKGHGNVEDVRLAAPAPKLRAPRPRGTVVNELPAALLGGCRADQCAGQRVVGITCGRGPGCKTLEVKLPSVPHSGGRPNRHRLRRREGHTRYLPAVMTAA